MEILITGGVVGSIASLIALGWWKMRQFEQLSAMRNQLLTPDVIFLSTPWSGMRVQIATPVGDKRWQGGMLMIAEQRIAIYPERLTDTPQPMISLDSGDLRGFWRPEAYHNGKNEIWLHVYNKRWIVLKVQVNRGVMSEIVRAIKQIATPEQITAYRRRRPYIHLGPDYAQPAQQSLQGDWQLEDPVELYLMPAALVVIERDGLVRTIYPLAEIQNIAALRRMEGGSLPGLLRFSYQGQMVAFAVHDWESWASNLAEAAKRTLEAPVIRKSKRHDEIEED
jgi:hypothetical protein